MARRARFGFADRPACAIDVAVDLDEIAEVRKPSASGGLGSPSGIIEARSTV